MRLVVGTYRKRTHIEDCLRSIDSNVRGVGDIVFVDDSGDREHCDWLRQYGEVVWVGGRGYTTAMWLACQQMTGDYCAWTEEDFTFTEPVDLEALAGQLEHRPELAQLALLRQPWFDFEVEAGGLIEGLLAKGNDVKLDRGVWVQDFIFTTNPSVWRRQAWTSGWPDAEWSEAAKSEQLREAGWTFGWAEGVKVHHDGKRTGIGY